MLDLAQVEGIWVDSYDDASMGYILDQAMHWNDAQFQHAATPLTGLSKQSMQ